jgi:hypothetical protein
MRQAYVDLALTASVTVEVKKDDTGARSFGDVVSVQEVEVTEVHEHVQVPSPSTSAP